MNYLKMLIILTISIATSALFLCINKPIEPDNLKDRVAYKGLYGKLVNIDGKAVSGAKVKAVNVSNGLQKVSKGVFISSSKPDSVYTDSGGYYSF